MTIQIVRLVNNCFNFELELKKAGSTNNKTPTTYIMGTIWSIKAFSLIYLINNFKVYASKSLTLVIQIFLSALKIELSAILICLASPKIELILPGSKISIVRSEP